MAREGKLEQRVFTCIRNNTNIKPKLVLLVNLPLGSSQTIIPDGYYHSCANLSAVFHTTHATCRRIFYFVLFYYSKTMALRNSLNN